MNGLRCGQLVKSKAGRDKNKIFIIIDMQQEYLYLVDGKQRRVENPKRKKYKHVQLINIIVEEIEDKIINEKKLTNADIRKSLTLYQKDLN